MQPLAFDFKGNDPHVSGVWFFRDIIVRFNTVKYCRFDFFDTGPTPTLALLCIG